MYFVLILVYGLNINHRLEINHLCEFGPISLFISIVCLFFGRYIFIKMLKYKTQYQLCSSL